MITHQSGGMPNFWKQLFKLEKAMTQSSPSQPIIHELIRRSEEDIAAYERWKSSFVLRRLLDWLEACYATYRTGKTRTDDSIDFLRIPSSQGFILYFHRTNYTREEATFLFDYFKERVKTLDYRTQLSDTRTYERRQWVETVEKHYLKPRFEVTAGERMNQRFGNITIELEIRDNLVHHLRLRATHYQDRNFTPPQDFAELMGTLLDRRAV